MEMGSNNNQKLIGNEKNNKFISFFWICLISSALWGAALPGIDIGVGYLYIFRLLLPIFVLYIIFQSRFDNIFNQSTLLICAIWLFYGFLALLWTPDTIASIKGLVNYFFGIFFMISIMVLLSDYKKINFTVGIIIINLLIFCGLGIIEAYTGTPFFGGYGNAVGFITSIGYYYPFGTFANPNDLIFCLLSFLPFIIIFISIKIRKKLVKYIIYLFFVGLFALMIILADNRMGFIVLPLIIILFIFFSLKKQYQFPILILTIIFSFAIVLLGYVDLSVISEEARVTIWKNILLNGWNFGFMGTGIGNSFYRLPNIDYVSIDWLMNPHFWFLEIFVEFGIIIFAMIMAWGLYIALKNLKLYQSISISEHAKKYSKATMVFMVVFTPLSVMSASISAMPNFWLLLGIVCAITNINYKKTIKRS